MDLLVLSLTVAVIGFAVWSQKSRSRKSKSKPLAADRPTLPYSVFTRVHDEVCPGNELEDVLDVRAIDRRAPANVGPLSVHERSQVVEDYRAEARASLNECDQFELSDAGILILLDQSGSMAERMPAITGELAECLKALERFGAKTALMGFTTVGWRGGSSRLDWIDAGSPPFPGRLCDTLHVIYKDFTAPAKSLDLSPLLRTDVFFENVDGEALLFGREWLKSAEISGQRILLIISDGAPVDDSTLQENGASILWRHLKLVIGQIQADPSVALAALGIEYRVDELYENSVTISDGEALSTELFGLIRSVSGRIEDKPKSG